MNSSSYPLRPWQGILLGVLLGVTCWRPAGAAEAQILYVIEAIAGGAAAEAGLQEGDGVLSIDGQSVTTLDQASPLISSAPDRTLIFEVQRARARLFLPVKIRNVQGVGRIGARLGNLAAPPTTPQLRIEPGMHTAMSECIRETFGTCISILILLR